MLEYQVDLKRLHLDRRAGISGFMRIRNEEEFMSQAIESHLQCLDELVIVYNRCNDRSEELIADYAAADARIKSYHYEPIVYPQGSEQYRELPENSANSLVNYFNYALSKTTCRTVVKIDGDDIAIPDKIRRITDNIRAGGLQPGQFLITAGINLWQHHNRIYFNGRHPFPGLDHGFFQVTEGVYYKKGEQCEYLTGKLDMLNAGYMYYHVKGLKKDRGLDNYDFKLNPESFYRQTSYNSLDEDELLTFEQFLEEYPQLKDIPDPEKIIRLPSANN